MFLSALWLTHLLLARHVPNASPVEKARQIESFWLDDRDCTLSHAACPVPTSTKNAPVITNVIGL
jgi:hypothetical protein